MKEILPQNGSVRQEQLDPFALKSPAQLLMLIALAVFVAETFVMLLFNFLPPQSYFREAFMDASLLVILITPTLYLFLFRPMAAHIRQRQQLEDTLRRNEEEQFKIMVRALLDSFWITDKQGRFLEVNDAYCKLIGYDREELLGMCVADVEAEETSEETAQHICKIIETGSDYFETRHRCKDGRILDVEASVNYSHAHGGRFYCFLRDITKRKLAEEQVRHRAHYDALTGLPNRALFYDRFRQSLATARRRNTHLALMYLDLDRFKPINDKFGHEMGDLLLEEVARRLQHCVRETDTVARMGGDEFVVLLPTVDAERDASRVAEKMLYALSQPYQLLAQCLHISSSIGVAVYPQHGSDERPLLKHADMALYFAKGAGRNNVQLYQPDMEGVVKNDPQQTMHQGEWKCA
ncbi:MAG: diguanylate cyclase [Nitrosomonadales bacterium]|nr:diguanylate cyclase [Nitrosomonadales bacterium]